MNRSSTREAPDLSKAIEFCSRMRRRRRARLIQCRPPSAPLRRSPRRRTGASPMAPRPSASAACLPIWLPSCATPCAPRTQNRYGDLHPHDRSQPEAAASPRSCRGNRRVDTSARPFQSQAIEHQRKHQFGRRNFGLSLAIAQLWRPQGEDTAPANSKLRHCGEPRNDRKLPGEIGSNIPEFLTLRKKVMCVKFCKMAKP